MGLGSQVVPPASHSPSTTSLSCSALRTAYHRIQRGLLTGVLGSASRGPLVLSSGSQTWTLPSRGHWTTFEDTSVVTAGWGLGMVLLVSGRQRPEVPLNILQYTALLLLLLSRFSPV